MHENDVNTFVKMQNGETEVKYVKLDNIETLFLCMYPNVENLETFFVKGIDFLESL